jgi:hypothetical protein
MGMWREPYFADADEGAKTQRELYHIPRSLEFPARNPVVKKSDVMRRKHQSVPFGMDVPDGADVPHGLQWVKKSDVLCKQRGSCGITDCFLPGELRYSMPWPVRVPKAVKPNVLKKVGGRAGARGRSLVKGM